MSDIPEFPERFNMASYFVDSNMEAGRGNKVAIHYNDQAVTFKQAYENVNRAGNGLKALGLQPEQRVLTVLHDRPEFDREREVLAGFSGDKRRAHVRRHRVFRFDDDFRGRVARSSILVAHRHLENISGRGQVGDAAERPGAG